MRKRTKLAIFGLIVITATIAGVLAMRARGKGYKGVITPAERRKNLVFDIKRGQFIGRNEAYSTKAPYLSLCEVSYDRRYSRWDFLTGPKYDYTVALEAANMDMEYSPSKNSGKPLRKTSSYVWSVGPDRFDHPILFKTYDGTAGILEITKVKHHRNIHFRYKILKRSDSDVTAKSAPDTNEQFAVTLPDGRRVEVVGISYCPSVGKLWWKPNGERLERAPYINKRRAFRRAKPGRMGYEIAYRVTGAGGAEAGATLRFADRVGVGTVRPQDEFGHRFRNVQAEAISVNEDVTSTTIGFGITPGPWQTVLATKEDNVSREYDSKFIGISQPEIIDGKIKIVFTLSRAWSDDYSTRFVVVDYSGKAQDVGGYSEDMSQVKPEALRQRRHTFTIDDLSLSQIKEFRFEARPYRWVKFKNISLVPGKDTGFEIEVPER